MAELGRAGRLTRPVAAGVIGSIFISRAVGLRAGQHVMCIGCIPSTVDRAALLSQPGKFSEVVAEAREFQCVSVQVCRVIGDLFSLGVIPGTIPDAISRIDSVRAAGAEVGVEGLRASRRSGERLADLVGAGQATKIGSF